MNVSRLFRTVYQTISFIDQRISSMKPSTNIFNRNIHNLCNRQYLNNVPSICTNKVDLLGLLQPYVPMYNPTCSFKMKTVLHRRCKSCLLLWKNDRKYVICKAHPRHNQVERKKQPYKTWILTFANQKPIRDW
ncbi:mitochondrial ribosomal protein L36 [Calliopsis andreniformis]|uniref:mitochondrial ribosomal protein L36 n=1 Tax=Calliopsis andreniformis TaxID=337506 RepID=UPI003FCDED24